MNAKLRQRIIKLTLLVATELTLNLVGLDTVANYSEFVFGQEFAMAPATSSTIALQIS